MSHFSKLLPGNEVTGWKKFENLEDMFSQWVSFTVLFTFLTLLAIGYIRLLADFSDYYLVLTVSFLFVLFVILLLWKLSPSNRHEDKEPKLLFKTVIACAGLSLLIFGFLMVSQIELTGDFKRNWEQAYLFSQGAEVNWGSLHQARSRVMLSPLVSVFGHNELAYKLANTLYLFIIMLSSGWIAFRCAGPRSLKAAVLACMLCVGPIVSALVPTHDIPGATVILLSTAFIIEICKSDRMLLTRDHNVRFPRFVFIALIVSGVALGFVLAWSYFVKSATPFYVLGGFIAILCSAMFDGKRSDKKIKPLSNALRYSTKLFLLMVPVVTATFIHVAFVDVSAMNKFETSSSRGESFWIAAHTNSHGDGTYRGDIEGFLRPYRDGFSEKTIEIAASDFADDPKGSVAHRLRKAKVLMNYSSGLNNFREVEVSLPIVKTKFILDISKFYIFVTHAFWLSVIFATMMILFSSHKIRTRSAIIVMPLMVTIVALVALGQVQARYILPIWFIGAIFIGIAVNSLSEFKEFSRSSLKRAFLERAHRVSLALLTTLVVGCLGVSGLALVIDKLYVSEEGRPDRKSVV